jgi:hypothetical protein
MCVLEPSVREGRAMRRVGEREVLAIVATGIAKNPLVAPIRRAGSAVDDMLS